jgi:hypothetical protein
VNLHKRDLSFYLVNERNNVAISRAKAKLIIVGSFKVIFNLIVNGNIKCRFMAIQNIYFILIEL